MVVPLMRVDADHPRLLKEVPIDESSRDGAIAIELDANELAESGRVVISDSLSVAKCL